MKLKKFLKEQLDWHTITFDCTGDAPEELVKFLQELEKMGRMGSSRGFYIKWDENHISEYGFDGDGADQIRNIRLDGIKKED